MPFSTEFDDIYQLGIKAACEATEAYCERVDEQYFKESILQRIYNQIAKADVIVAEMTNKNPNVFYEVGYAHALGKDVVLITQEEDDIPFDLKHHPHIVYRNKIADLKEKLISRLSWSVGVGKNNGSLEDIPVLDFLLNSKPILDDSLHRLKTSVTNEQGWIRVDIAVHNPYPKTVNIDESDLAIVIGKAIDIKGDGNTLPLPDGKHHINLPAIGNIYPGAWKSTFFDIKLRPVVKDYIYDGQIDDPYAALEFEALDKFIVELKHFQESGPREIIFLLSIEANA